MMIVSIEIIMLNLICELNLLFLVEIYWETFHYIHYYKVKSFDEIIHGDVDVVSKNLGDDVDIVERITLQGVFNDSR